MEFDLIAQTEFSWFELASWIAIVKVVLGIGLLIFVHELGHFLAAKACGVRCDKFYIGFDAFDIKIGDFVLIPRRLFYFQWGETEYGIGIIPLGGYVKMFGQVDNPAEQEAENRRIRGEDPDQPADEASEGAAEKVASRDNAEQLDPRSYPAKSVPQRLFIISAGVVMNLILAVILASIAYTMGAPYQPAKVGGVVAGGPAWMADIQPGTQILSINGSTKPPEHLRWIDLSGEVALTGIGHEVSLSVRSPVSETAQDIVLVPSGDLIKATNISLGSVGLEPVSSNQIGDKPTAIFEAMAASRANPPLKPGDRIAAVNGVPTPFGHDLKRELLIHFDQTVSLTVERGTGDPANPKPPTETLTVEVPAQNYLTYGLQIATGPIAAVQPGSPADQGGLKVGDVIEAIDGVALGDVTLLANQLRRVARDAGQVVFRVKRGEEVLELPVKPRLPRLLLDGPGHLPMGIDELGITIQIGTSFTAVAADSPAALAGIQVGDQLESVQFLENGKLLTKESKLKANPEAISVGDLPQMWPTVMDVTQFMRPENEVKLVLKRGEETVEVTMKPTAVSSEFARSRGFQLKPFEEIMQAKSVTEAFSLGFREAKEDTFQVYYTLKQMLLGRVSAINLRGPGTIASGATMMALRGDAVLLLFLTLISANLAVVNFLPIPVLDGGHAVFLIYEGIFGKPPSERIYLTLMYAGFFMLIGLMVFVLTMDSLDFLFR